MDAIDLLCEKCGYILSGLLAGGNCPECGQPIAQSLGDQRSESTFEAAPSIRSFVRTTLALWTHPSRFFRRLTPRQSRRAIWFGRLHRALSAALLSVAICGHLMLLGRFKQWLENLVTGPGTFEPPPLNLYFVRIYGWYDEPVLFSLLLIPVAIVIYLITGLFSLLIVRIIAKAAGQRARSVRKLILRRVISFHSASLLPITLMLALTYGAFIATWWIVYYAGGPAEFSSWELFLRYGNGWRAYTAALTLEAALGLIYTLATLRLAILNMRYANYPMEMKQQ